MRWGTSSWGTGGRSRTSSSSRRSPGRKRARRERAEGSGRSEDHQAGPPLDGGSTSRGKKIRPKWDEAGCSASGLSCVLWSHCSRGQLRWAVGGRRTCLTSHQRARPLSLADPNSLSPVVELPDCAVPGSRSVCMYFRSSTWYSQGLSCLLQLCLAGNEFRFVASAFCFATLNLYIVRFFEVFAGPIF